MKHFILLFIFLALFTLISCNKKDFPIGNSNQDQLDPISNPVTLDCDKLTSKEEAENLMSQVADDRYTDSSSIIANLIGDWGLIGMVPGWIGFEPGQICLRLTIGPELIELEDLNSGNSSSSEWELITTETNGWNKIRNQYLL